MNMLTIMKYLCINLIKHLQSLCAKTDTMLMKEIKENHNTRRDIPSFGSHSIVEDTNSPQIDIQF